MPEAEGASAPEMTFFQNFKKCKKCHFFTQKYMRDPPWVVPQNIYLKNIMSEKVAKIAEISTQSFLLTISPKGDIHQDAIRMVSDYV